MKKLLLSILALSLITPIKIFAGSTPPKREFRGAWVATVTNLDWPSSRNLTAAAQRDELIRILDELQADGVNAVVFQVRPECDALYASTIEPWSYWLTGGQGIAPSPFYDPLELAIQEAHKRGMELHAWFNPYRAERVVGNYPLAPNHVTKQHPDWAITISNFKFLDPGLPMVRGYVTSVIMDVVKRYDVDGVHFDDYFYPYPPNQISNQDDKTFATYSRGFTSRADWRRDNVNLLIKMIHDSIQVVKPYIKFGMSPFGIWKSGTPAGISGLSAYDDIYCDAVAWLQQQLIDYLTPQLYWPFGGGQDYGKLMPWWAAQMNGRHLYTGQAVHRITSWAANEVPRQIRLNRNTTNARGSVFFRAVILRDNPKGFVDSLKTDLYRYPALPPVMAWKDTVPPNVPQNLRYQRIAGTGSAELRWDAPSPAADGSTASRYVVYRFESPTVTPNDLGDPSKIIALEGKTSSMPKTPVTSGNYHYTVTALDRNTNESGNSNVLLVPPPAAPMLAFPANNAPDQPASVALQWYYPPNAASYQLQVSLDSTFATALAVNESGLIDTFKVIAGLEGQQIYYWRVKASNAGGTSAFSSAYRFATGSPSAPVLAYPANNTGNIPVNLTFLWKANPSAQTYQLQVAKSLTFDSTAIVVDVKGLADTAYAVSQLEGNRFYFWRVRATNAIGESNWSVAWRFKTVDVTAVAEATITPPAQYQLYQNYPNPFNPMTMIVFDLPKPGTPQLVIFDVLGREILTLVNAPLAAGRHSVQFDASLLPSGVYYYRLNFEGRVLTRRMTVLK